MFLLIRKVRKGVCPLTGICFVLQFLQVMNVRAFTVNTTQPFHFRQMAKRLLRLEKSSYWEQDGKLMRTVRLHEEPYVIGICYDEGRGHIKGTVYGHPSASQVQEAERLIRHMFSAETDLSDFYRHAAAEPYLAPLIERFAGTRLVREPDLFECFVKTIISQQLNLAFAGTLTNRFIALAGDVVYYDGRAYPVFPLPEQVARLEYEELQQLQFSRRKAEYVIDLARGVERGEIDLGGLWEMTDAQVIEQLTRIRGVGRWTAECVLLFGMGRPDLLPAADIGLRNAVQKVYGLAEQPTEAHVREIGAAWSPWRSYATYYLWESLS